MVTGNHFVSKEQRKNKSQICNISRYFSRKGKKLSRKCDCIGHNFEPWINLLTTKVQWSDLCLRFKFKGEGGGRRERGKEGRRGRKGEGEGRKGGGVCY